MYWAFAGVMGSAYVVRDMTGPNVIPIWWPRRSGISSMTNCDATPLRESLAKASTTTIVSDPREACANLGFNQCDEHIAD